MKLKLIFVILTLVCAAGGIKANEPDSVFMFSYSMPDGNGGLRIAWSGDKDSPEWNSVGDGFCFLNSDFGPWGSGKKMFSPVLIYVPSESIWHCYWASTATGQTISHASSGNLISWNPQNYYHSKEHNSRMVKNGINPVKSKAVISGDTVAGTYTRVPFETIKSLNQYVDHRRYRDMLHAQRTADDSSRFESLKAQVVDIDIDGTQSKPISKNLIGIFFEDINYAADGGLYAELVQNRDFEYTVGENPRDGDWGPLKAWRTEDNATVAIDSISPIHENNPHYAILTKGTLVNEGYDGISLKKNEPYDFSARIRPADGQTCRFVVSLRNDNGKVVAKKRFTVKGDRWTHVKAVLTPDENVRGGSLALTLEDNAANIDMVSLFPRNTFKGHPNGLRPDLAEALANLHPKFMRFPGGCVAHGNGLDNIYDWKGSIGPLEARKPLSNIWRYHQTRGLGYHEYFLFCEDIGAEPLPVLAAGVPCQNSGMPHKHSTDELSTYGQQGGIPMEDMGAYVQDILDLIEYANGDSKTTVWGRKRAEAGHPEPFNLKYIGIGNEDIITDIFEERFLMIFNAIKERYPEITVVGTVGPFYEGTDYDEGWRFASLHSVPMVDEHYYVSPGWMINNQDYYDRYDRSKPHVYLGEYAAHLPGRPNNVETALAEALYLTSVERNGDIVEMTSYAPLLAKRGHTQWTPDLIYFDNDSVMPTVDYWTQQMYGENPGTNSLHSQVKFMDQNDKNVINRVGLSAVKDEDSGDVIIRLVNLLPVETKANLNLNAINIGGKAKSIVLSGAPDNRNAKPVISEITIDTEAPTYTMPPYSFTVLRIPTRK
ncbi:MAG: carbohydrate binding domain-containing protein [Lachnoclostridium sp.]|nr:carbohydrate binding domain-containing protein [Lachnoclostridium sp.]